MSSPYSSSLLPPSVCSLSSLRFDATKGRRARRAPPLLSRQERHRRPCLLEAHRRPYRHVTSHLGRLQGNLSPPSPLCPQGQHHRQCTFTVSLCVVFCPLPKRTCTMIRSYSSLLWIQTHVRSLSFHLLPSSHPHSPTRKESTSPAVPARTAPPAVPTRSAPPAVPTRNEPPGPPARKPVPAVPAVPARTAPPPVYVYSILVRGLLSSAQTYLYDDSIILLTALDPNARSLTLFPPAPIFSSP